jgi:hypothetical protein
MFQKMFHVPEFIPRGEVGYPQFFRALNQEAQRKGLYLKVVPSPRRQGFIFLLTTQKESTQKITYQDAFAQIYNYHPKKHHTVAPKPDIEVHLL